MSVKQAIQAIKDGDYTAARCLLRGVVLAPLDVRQINFALDWSQCHLGAPAYTAADLVEVRS